MRAPSWHNCPESYPAEQHLHARGEEPFPCTSLQFTTKWEWGGRRGGHLNQWCKPEHCHADRVTWLMHWSVGRRDERKEVNDERERQWIAQRTRPRKSRPCSVTRLVLCSPAWIRGWKYFTADELLKAQREKGGSEGHTDGQTRERGGNKLCNKLSEGKDSQQQNWRKREKESKGKMRERKVSCN